MFKKKKNTKRPSILKALWVTFTPRGITTGLCVELIWPLIWSGGVLSVPYLLFSVFWTDIYSTLIGPCH